MNQAYTSLEEENESLTDQLKLRSANEEEGQIVISKWKEENDQLKEKVAEQEYIRDVLQEKKLQIEFLQNQLEQRIKTNHLDEYQKSQLHSEIDRLKQVHGDDLKKQENLEAAYQQRNEEVEKLQTVLNDREQQLAEKQSLLASKLDRITRLENELHEATGKNEQLNHKMNESNELIARLQAQVSAEQLKAEEFEQKYLLQRQSLQRMHSDISLMVEGETSPSPVIPLRPEYLTREADEIAVH